MFYTCFGTFTLLASIAIYADYAIYEKVIKIQASFPTFDIWVF